jgi:hypothetical protein
MPSQPIDAEDLAAALAAFSIEIAHAIMSPRHQTPNELLEALANQLDTLAKNMEAAEPTPASKAIRLTAQMLIASETGR